MYPRGGTRTLPQGSTVVSWLFFPCLCIPSLPFPSLPFPSLTSSCFNLLCWNSGNVLGAEWSLYPARKKWGTQAFVPRSPTKPCLISVWRYHRAHRQSVGGGHQEDVTAGSLLSWAQGVRDSSLLPLPLPLHCTFCPPDPHMELCPWETCWDLLLRPSGWMYDWTQLRSLCKPLRFWWAGIEIYMSCGHTNQASYVSSLIY